MFPDDGSPRPGEHLDDGETVRLRAGDTLVQNGTRHAWHNRGTEPCVVVACLVGAERQST